MRGCAPIPHSNSRLPRLIPCYSPIHHLSLLTTIIPSNPLPSTPPQLISSIHHPTPHHTTPHRIHTGPPTKHPSPRLHRSLALRTNSGKRTYQNNPSPFPPPPLSIYISQFLLLFLLLSTHSLNRKNSVHVSGFGFSGAD